MNKLFLFFGVLIFAFASCKKQVQTTNLTAKKSDMTIAVKHLIKSKLTPSSEKMITEWKEYQTMKELMSSYENISPEEAMGNTYEVQETIKFLKDSLNIKPLKTPAFRSRLNVLENEILRLSDMGEIPAITATEVNNQVDKMLLVFSSLNDKINTVHNQEEFNNEINLDDFFALEKDSITKLKENLKKDKNEIH